MPHKNMNNISYKTLNITTFFDTWIFLFFISISSIN
jgi:hypothetical protein